MADQHPVSVRLRDALAFSTLDGPAAVTAASPQLHATVSISVIMGRVSGPDPVTRADQSAVDPLRLTWGRWTNRHTDQLAVGSLALW